MAALNRVAVQPAGTSLGLTAAAAGGDTYLPSTGRERLTVRNNDATLTTVTIANFETRNGLAVPARAWPVAAGDVAQIPLLPGYYDPANNNRVSFTYSKVTTLFVGITD